MANNTDAALAVEVVPAPTPSYRAARIELARAVLRYAALALRPRSADAWAAVANRLWNARANAVAAGALIKHRPNGELTDEYRFVSDRYTDAEQRVVYLRSLETAQAA